MNAGRAGILLAALVSGLDLGAVPAASSDRPSCPIEARGFLLGAVSSRTTGATPARGDGDLTLGEARVRFDLSSSLMAGAAAALVKVDVFYDAVDNRADADLREAYATYTAGPLDLYLGRQVVTWGVGDLFFITDVFPKDWESFFSGRPMEYLKLGADGVRARYSGDVVNVELMVLPLSFTPDALPSAERFVFFDPFSGAPDQRVAEPASRLSNTEAALRVYRNLAGFDVSAYGYRGFQRTPAVRADDPVAPRTVTRLFPELWVYGASAQRGVGAGVFSLEAGYYDSRQDAAGTDPAIPNSHWRLLAGYQRELWTDLIAAVQAYAEVMDDHGAYRASLPPGRATEDEFRGVGSIRVTQFLQYQTWKLGVFGAYSPTDDDYFVQAEAVYKVSDQLSLASGANVFGGRSNATFFGRFDESDNAFLRVRCDF